MTPAGTIRFHSEKRGVEAKPYYHGLLPREDILLLLRQNGDYILRTTEFKTGGDRRKCLSVMWDKVVRHFLLQPTKRGVYSLEPGDKLTPEFSSIEHLMDYYVTRREPFSTYKIRLFTPILRQPWEFRHSQIELCKKLGEGAFGEVYSGFLNINERRKEVAVNTLKCNSQVTKEKIEETMKEARLMRQLRHRNVVRLYGVAAEEEPLMIIMERIHDGALVSYLQEAGANIPTSVRLQMSCEAALGVEYIHKRGVIHRDIASRNCLYGDGV